MISANYNPVRQKLMLLVVLIPISIVLPACAEVPVQVCRKLDQNPVDEKSINPRNKVYKKFLKDMDTVIDGEELTVSFRVNNQIAGSCKLRVYGSFVVSELKGLKKPRKRHFDIVANNTELSIELISTVLDEISSREDYVEYGNFLKKYFSQRIIDLVMIEKIKKFTEDPISPYSQKIAFFGRIATIRKLPEDLIRKLKKVDYMAPIPKNRRYANYLSIDDAVVTLAILHNVGVRAQKKELDWLYSLLSVDYSRYDLEESVYGKESASKKEIERFIDQLNARAIIKNSDIPVFWEG